MFRTTKISTPTLCIIGGDGIGPDVVACALRVLQTAGFRYRKTEAVAGFAAFEQYGTPLPDATLEACRNADAILFGAVTTPPNIPGYFSPIVRLRKELGLFANTRPFLSLPASGISAGVNIIMVRENTEDLYTGKEREITDGFVAERIITRSASRRIVTYAFELARKLHRKRVTAVHKANVLRLTDGLFLQEATAVATSYPDIEFNDMLVDACALQLIRKPELFDVLVTTNMFGDILSDEIAGLVGGLGLAASANIGDTHALFEPVHGSAPKYAGTDTANPTAAILAACLMLDHLQYADIAGRIRHAVSSTIASGLTTADLGGSAGTTAFTDAVIDHLPPQRTGRKS